eukprot:scaffold2874_cov116-Isochrysis_galbana.AAC.5
MQLEGGQPCGVPFGAESQSVNVGGSGVASELPKVVAEFKVQSAAVGAQGEAWGDSRAWGGREVWRGGRGRENGRAKRKGGSGACGDGWVVRRVDSVPGGRGGSGVVHKRPLRSVARGCSKTKRLRPAWTGTAVTQARV